MFKNEAVESMNEHEDLMKMLSASQPHLSHPNESAKCMGCVWKSLNAVRWLAIAESQPRLGFLGKTAQFHQCLGHAEPKRQKCTLKPNKFMQ